MAKTAEQILKAQGMTDADIATLLSNPLTRKAIEDPFNTLETERDTYKTRDAEWQKLHDEKWSPALAATEKEAIDARLEAARYKAIAQAAKDFGYVNDEDATKAAEAAEATRRAASANTGGGFNDSDPKFLDFAGKFSMAEGDAMARQSFVSEEFRRLEGGSINDYVGRDGKRGMIALRAEALAAKEQLHEYAEKKFGWEGKRRTQEEKRLADRDAEVGRKAVEEYALKHGTNPMTQMPTTSRNPFVPMSAREGKQPWDDPTAKSDRLRRAYESETKAQVRVN